ncbi:Coiled-coil domain-containing protein 22 [Desmophyllum pertusum]|uniref:Coiled-coil domain-containing protein 22 n=1 Tax=Desmophyllum pertusum TaxID=174260 RepID=A0A9W9ZA33_9CNID|nr:Coiled-coil domain-containing protein 22 [Desmophyllum pertusum]
MLYTEIHSERRGALVFTEIKLDLINKASGTAAPSKGSRFTRTEQLQFAQDEQKAVAMVGLSEEGPPKKNTEEVFVLSRRRRKKRKEELEALQSKLRELNASIEHDEVEIKKSLAGIQQTNEQVSSQKTKNAEQEEVYKVKKRTIDLLPDAENSIAKLQDVVDASAQRLVNLAQQWEKHRAPLVDQYRELKQLNANRVVVEYETMRKDVNRSAYTRRILEIVGNIKKQKEEINKILIDTKAVQKEINQLSGKLDRTFAATDELIFRIEMESQKNTATNLERISADFKQMKEENNTLTKKTQSSQIRKTEISLYKYIFFKRMTP